MNNISDQLKFLESMGYNTQKLKSRFEELSRLVEWKRASLKACEEDDNDLKEWKSQIETFEAKNCSINFFIVEERRQLQRLDETLAANQSVIDSQKDKQAAIQEQ